MELRCMFHLGAREGGAGKEPVLDSFGRKGTTWPLAKPPIKSRDLLLWESNFIGAVNSFQQPRWELGT